MPAWWDIAVLVCRHRGAPAPFVGGSSVGTARDVAMNKAYDAGFVDSECRDVRID